MTTTVAELSVKVSGDLAPLLSALKKAQSELTAFDKAATTSARKINTSIGNIKPSINTNNARMQLSTLELYAQKTGAKINSALNIKPNIKVAPVSGDGSSSFSNAERSVSNLQSSVSRLALVIGTYLSVEKLREYADTWTEAGNKIRAAAEIAGVQARSLENVNKIATETRSSIEETADLYSKLIRTASGVAKSENEIALATELINKAFKAGGSSLMEQKNGIVQLSQALGSGVFQGDELRSVRENAPVIAQAIAKEFNTTIAGLKKLGAEGKLTSAGVLRGILNAQKEIEAAFAKTTPTIDEQFNLLKNGLIEYIGNTAKSIGVTQTISNVMKALTENIGSVATAAAAAAAVLLGLVAVPAIIAAVANPFVLLAAAVGGAAYAITELWDDIVPLQGSVASLGDYFTVFWNAIKDGASATSEAISNAFSTITGFLTESMSGVGEIFQGVEDTIYSFVNGVVDSFVKMKDSVVTAFEVLPQAIASGVIEAMNTMIDKINIGLDAVVNKVNSAIKGINTVIEYAGGTGFKTIDPYKIGEIENKYKGAGEKAAKAFLDIKNRPTEDWIGEANKDITDATNNAIAGVVARANAVHRAKIENGKDQDQDATAAGEFGGATRGYGGGISTPDTGTGKKKKENAFESEVRQITERTATLKAQTEAQSKLNPLVDDYGYAVEYAKSKQELLNAAEKAHVKITPEIAANIEKLATAYASAHVESEKLTQQQDLLKQQYEDLRSTSRDVMQGFVKDLIDGKSAAEALSNALQKIADKLLDKAFDLLFNSKEKGGSGLFDSLFSGFFNSSGPLNLGNFLHFANGGYVSGPGNGTSDSITAQISNGEFITNAKQTAKYRPLLEAINANKVPKFASGGYVSVPNARMGTGSISMGGARQQLDIKLQTDDSMIAAVADARIRNATPNIVGTSVKIGQQQTKQNFGQYVSNYNARQG